MGTFKIVWKDPKEDETVDADKFQDEGDWITFSQAAKSSAPRGCRYSGSVVPTSNGSNESTSHSAARNLDHRGKHRLGGGHPGRRLPREPRSRRTRAGWSVGQAAWRLGVSVRG